MFETDPHFLYPQRAILFLNGKLELASTGDYYMGNVYGSMLGGGGASDVGKIERSYSTTEKIDVMCSRE